MDDDFDIKRLGEIPDPFQGSPGVLPPKATTMSVPALPPALTQSELRTRRWIAAIVALGYEAALLVMMGVRPDLSEIPMHSLALGILAPLLAAGIALQIGTHGGRRGVGLPAVTVASFLLLPLASFALGAVLLERPVRVMSEHVFWTTSVTCIVGVMMLAMGPLVLSVVAYRSAFAAAAPWRTAALGVASGAFAAAVMDLSCAIDGRLHVLVGHGAPLILGGLIGLGLARFTRT